MGALGALLGRSWGALGSLLGDLGRFVLLFCALLGALGPNFAIFIDFLSISGASRDAPTLENHRFSLVKRRFFRKLDFSSGAAVGLAFCLPGRALGTLLGSSWPLLGCSWALLGPSWTLLGRSWDALGALLGAFWVLLGRSWVHLGALGQSFGPLGVPPDPF